MCMCACSHMQSMQGVTVEGILDIMDDKHVFVDVAKLVLMLAQQPLAPFTCSEQLLSLGLGIEHVCHL